MRVQQRDVALDALQDERDHLAIKLSLLKDAPEIDRRAIADMQQELLALERRISHHRPADASGETREARSARGLPPQ